jgi:phosphate starvation-inducible PhoH-like protein|tara:strand:+ start:15937 stop:16659 length:723 start_codon:yes stop_codon:yes gene_type:complete
MSARRSRKSKNFHNNVVQLNNYLPEKKKTVKIYPRNRAQETYLLTLSDTRKDVVFGIGPAGTGKTLIAVLTAVKLFKEGVIDKIIVTRPAVSVDEDLGFLPGTLEQKMAPWTRPVFDVLRDYFTSQEITGMIDEGVIEIAPLAYMRGRTFKRAFIVADEMQNSTASQMKMLLTRLGEGSKMAVTGDLNQADRMSDNGLLDFISQLKRHQKASRLACVTFNHADIERHEAVKEVLEVYGDE